MADQNSKIQLEGRATTMNAVLISIRPKWCEKIISGEKTIEVRKTRPKLATPFKCRIYCTRGRHDLNIPISREALMRDWLETGSMKSMNCPHGNGKVIGEFTCDEIFCFPADSAIPWFLSRDACLTAEEIQPFCLHILFESIRFQILMPNPLRERSHIICHKKPPRSVNSLSITSIIQDTEEIAKRA